MKRHQSISSCKTGIILIVFLFLSAGYAEAQRAPGEVGLGVQIGEPTGFTVKIYHPTTSLDFLAAWDINHYFFLNIHAIYDTHFNNAQTIHFFYGPGGYIRVWDRSRQDLDDEIELGVSGNFGLDFLIRKFEIFAQVTPRLSLIQSTNFDMGGGIGFRFYL